MNEFEYGMFTDNGLFVEVNKVGGGTADWRRVYEGDWEYRVSNYKGVVIAHAYDLHTGTPKTHYEAAAIVADYFISEV